MKTPICSFDAKTGTLCSKCEDRLRSGHLTQADVECAVKLVKIAERDQEINKFTMINAYHVNGDIVLVLQRSDLSTLRSNVELSRKIQQQFQSKVWFVEAEATDRRFLENLFFPARILTINLIWLPDGNKLTKVIVAAKDAQVSGIDVEQIQKITKTVRNMELLVDFESTRK
ncbi:MAG: transcription elongation factor NusA [Thermoproteota archaeon]|nr:transcription elongation factor NusA [Thermoproteota archaeon]